MKDKKVALRKEIQQKLKTLSSKEITEQSKEIARKLYSLPRWMEAEILLGYMPMRYEADVTEILSEAFRTGKHVAVPRMKNGNCMDFHRIDSTEGPWEHHEYGIREPYCSNPIFDTNSCPDQRILIIVPGLAFDRQCNRLGRGKGFYDRYLSTECDNITAIGIGFAFQIVEEVPVTKDDKMLDGIVTEKEIIVP